MGKGYTALFARKTDRRGLVFSGRKTPACATRQYTWATVSLVENAANKSVDLGYNSVSTTAQLGTHLTLGHHAAIGEIASRNCALRHVIAR